MKRFIPTAIISILAIGFALSQVSTTSAVTITYVGSKQAQQSRTSTFVQFTSPPGLITAPVRTTTKTFNTKAWYDQGAPFVVAEMLPVVVLTVVQNENVAGITWAMNPPVSVPEVGSLNGYLAYWQSGAPLSGNQAYWPGCNIVPPPHQCWRAVPDWLISPSYFIKTDYSINPPIPWMTWQRSGNSGTYQYGGWF